MSFSKNVNINGAMSGTIGGDSPTNEVAHGASAEATVPMPLDKPTNGLEPPPFVRNPLGYFSNTTNITFNEVMTMYPHGALTGQTKISHFQSTADEMAISYLARIWNLSYTVPVTSSTFGMLAYGSISPMSPLITGIPLVQRPATGSNFIMTTLDYISAKHQHWRGGIELKLQFVCSPFNTGRFFIGFHYGLYINPLGLTLD
jgi:hypothetical protein